MTRKNPILMAALSILAVAALIAGGSMLATTNTFAGSDEKKMDVPEGATKVVIPTKGMTCGGCSSAVKTAVKKLDGVINVEVDHEAGSTTVVYKTDKVTVKEIVAAINKTGFEAAEPKDA
jgi:copper chaperone CopZ